MKKSNNIISSFKYAISGIKSAFTTERNMKIHIVIMAIVIVIGSILKISKCEWIICIILFALVLSAELINTAIETVVDMVMPEINEKAKIAKDVSAGSVLIMAFFATVIGLIIFIPKIIIYFF